MIKFNGKLWLKPYIDMNTDLEKTRKHDFEKDFFKLRKNSVFGKIKENVRTNIDIKLITAERRRIYLVSGSNFHSTNFSKYVSKDTYE